MPEKHEPYLAEHKITKYILKHVTVRGTTSEFPGPFPGHKTLMEFVEMVKDPRKGGFYYIVKRVETVEETIVKSIPNK